MLRQLLLAVCLLALAMGSVRAEEARAPALDAGLRERLAALPHLYGKALAADSLAGRVVVVTFFASWCPPCVTEFGHLGEVHAAYGDKGFEIVAVNLFEDFGGLSSPAKLAAFLERFAPQYPVVRGDDAVSHAFGGIDRIPTLFVFDRAGRPAFAFVHEQGATKTYVGAEELKDVIAALL